jgi:NitT/TauT family transport system ATP-binding protein
MTQAPAVKISHLSKKFSANGPIIIDDLNLEIRAGEFVSLVGASGCGKSTLLNILSGLDSATSGTVEMAEQSTLMFQESALLPWLTAGKNIELALKLSGFPKEGRKARAQELLELVHLPNAYNQRPHELSGGMRQRVAIARALSQGRKVLLMDEPFAALDAINRDLLHDELVRIWEETGLTVIFVTHNVREAVRLGQRVILMSSKPGRIIQEWDVAALAHEITDRLRNEIRRHAN